MYSDKLYHYGIPGMKWGRLKRYAETMYVRPEDKNITLKKKRQRTFANAGKPIQVGTINYTNKPLENNRLSRKPSSNEPSKQISTKSERYKQLVEQLNNGKDDQKSQDVKLAKKKKKSRDPQKFVRNKIKEVLK